MIRIDIHEESCRGCQICVDLCPTKVFRFDAAREKAEVAEAEDCIACLSCSYACPAHAIAHANYHVVKNFYRSTQHVRCLERFL
jgi:NAD-dependent dihydropyrimidine dehydrogenase PreA subunit